MFGIKFGGIGESQNKSTSTSDNSQRTTNETQDNRISTAANSTALGLNRSTVKGNLSIVSTDYGSVAKSFDFAKSLAQGAADDRAASISAMKSTQIAAMDSVGKAYSGVSEKIASAYTESKAGEQKVMVAAGLALVAFVALKMFGGK